MSLRHGLPVLRCLQQEGTLLGCSSQGELPGGGGARPERLGDMETGGEEKAVGQQSGCNGDSRVWPFGLISLGLE